MPKLSSSLSLFNAEFRKAWSFPILELAVGLVALISISSIQTLQQIVAQPNFEATFNSLVVNSLSATMNSQLLLLGLLCGILVSLSFTRDYEQGLTQTLLSWPISRSSLFVVKLVVVVLPLALLSWILTSAIVVLNFYGTMSTTLAVLGASAWIFPVTLLALMFYGGVATVVALVVKRTIPTVLSVALIGFFVWFILQ
jgi:ABC-type transport system involved in multi-copper enzyme maturation permease subunit